MLGAIANWPGGYFKHFLCRMRIRVMGIGKNKKVLKPLKNDGNDQSYHYWSCEREIIIVVSRHYTVAAKENTNLYNNVPVSCSVRG